MFRNYLKVSFRNIMKHKGFAFINIAGLAIAMSVCIIIMLWCRYELGYNRHLDNYEQIYRVNTEFHLSAEVERYESSPEPTGGTLVELFPEVTNFSQIFNVNGLMVFEDKKFMEHNLGYTHPDFLMMFSIQAIYGDINTMLDDPYAIVFTESMAKKYFGDRNPIGEVIRRNDYRDYNVTGVIADFPKNSTYAFDFIMSSNLFTELGIGAIGKWNNISGETLIMTAPNTNVKELGEKIWNVPNEQSPGQKVCNLKLQPLSKIHLYNLDGSGAIQYIYIFMAVGFIVLIIACINFMNLSTARSSIRAKEVGIRKVSGAQRNQLLRQFYGESLLLSILAMILAVVITEITISTMPRFALIKESFSLLKDFSVVLSIIGITLFTGILAGSYPAFFLSSFSPIAVLKGVFNRGKKGNSFRRILVITQFSLSIILIISTLIVFKQMNFMKNKDLGFDKDNLIYLPIKGELAEKFPEFKEELQKIPGIQNVTRASSILTQIGGVASGLNWEGKPEDEDPIFNFEGIDYDFFKTYKMEFVEGRGFSTDFADDENNYILNETAIRRIGYEGNAVGRMFDMWGRTGKVIGIIKDFNFQDQTEEINPLILTHMPRFYSYIIIRTDTGDLKQVVSSINKTWDSLVAQFPFEYHFMDEDFERLYKFEDDMGSLFQIFTLLAVVISCLGLFGLVTFVVERRTKEIGVRKILGASSGGLIVLLIKDFTKWVLLANILAWPLAWYIMNRWLQNYAYKVEMDLLPFLAAGLAALIIAIFTVFIQTYLAANANPIKALKWE